jgi:dihydrofolate reductase
MRKIIVIEFITMDGVIQGPGGPNEDTSGDFLHGGWIGPYSDEAQSTVIRQQMNTPFDLLIGRNTYDIWAPYWPHNDAIWPGVNRAIKYVASNTVTESKWDETIFLSGDVATHIRHIKQSAGRDLHVYGSAMLVQTLLAHDLVDEFWLKIHPITFGTGKRLFTDGAIPAAFSVTKCEATTTGVIMVNSVRAGAIPTK